jgi:hypothetical protein
MAARTGVLNPRFRAACRKSAPHPSTLSLSKGCLVLRAVERGLKKERQPFDRLREDGEGKAIQNFCTPL